MLRRLLGRVRVVLVIGLTVGLLAACGGPPDFHGGPGEVRASPLDFGQGQANHPANITVDGTGLFIFTQGIRKVGDGFEVSLSAIPNPSGPRPSGNAVQGWYAKGDTMQVAGLTVTVLRIYPGDGESGWADVRVTRTSS
ncbi:hypothetical protein [Nocardioides montaniterrae]